MNTTKLLAIISGVDPKFDRKPKDRVIQLIFLLIIMINMIFQFTRNYYMSIPLCIIVVVLAIIILRSTRNVLKINKKIRSAECDIDLVAELKEKVFDFEKCMKPKGRCLKIVSIVMSLISLGLIGAVCVFICIGYSDVMETVLLVFMLLLFVLNIAELDLYGKLDSIENSEMYLFLKDNDRLIQDVLIELNITQDEYHRLILI